VSSILRSGVSFQLAAEDNRKLEAYATLRTPRLRREDALAMSESNHPTPPARLTGDEAVELAAQVAELAKAGLPLPGGLRALADELPYGRLVPAVRALAERLEAGDSLEAAMEAQGHALPPHVRGLVLAGVRSGRLPEVLDEFIALERSRRELGRRIWAIVAYPLFLLAVLTLVFSFLSFCVVPQYAELFRDFAVALPIVTEWFVVTCRLLPCLLVVLLGAVFVTLAVLTSFPYRPLVWLLQGVPMIGPLWRWNGLAQFSRLMHLLLLQGIPSPDVLRTTATALRDGALAAGCRRVAAKVESGCSLSDALVTTATFPPSLIPLIQWGERNGALPEAFLAAAEMFDGRLETEEVFLASVLLPMMFLFITLFVSFFVMAMFMPLISLIQKLT